jgi:hypothetical protein
VPQLLFDAIVVATLLAMLRARERLGALAGRQGFRLALAALVADLVLILLHLASGGADFFYLNAERNLPTWFSTVQLFAVAMAVDRKRRLTAAPGALATLTWVCMAALFAYLALDESLMIHERIGRALSARYFQDFLESYYKRPVPTASAWPVFYLPLILGALAFLGVFYRRFLAGAPPPERGMFVAGVALFTAAILAEVIGVQFRESAFYRAFILVEESSELIGATAFLGWAVGTGPPGSEGRG